MRGGAVRAPWTPPWGASFFAIVPLAMPETRAGKTGTGQNRAARQSRTARTRTLTGGRPLRLPPFFSMYRSSDSLLSDCCMNCFSRSSKSVGSLGACRTKPMGREAPPCWGRPPPWRMPPPWCIRRPGGGTLRRGLHLLDGQVDPVGLVDADDLDLDLLPLVEVIRHLIDIGIGDLRDMDQSASPLRQGHKGPEFCDPRHLAVHDGPNSKLHRRPKYPPL